MATIDIIFDDITKLEVQAIVCPAHRNLIKGRGLSASVYDAAGEEMVAACNALPDCPIGEARITPGFALPAKHVIHTVTPQWSGGDQWGSADLHMLRNCYKSVFSLALEHGVSEIALPPLGAGSQQAPNLIASKISFYATSEYSDKFHRIILCLPTEEGAKFWRDQYDMYCEEKNAVMAS